MATYIGPGVTITEVPNPAMGALPAGFRIPGLVGTGDTKLPVKNTAVVKGSTNSTDTINIGADTLVSISAIGDVPDLEQYIEGVDWRQIGSTVQWISGGQQPTTGATYYVSWYKAKVASDYLPIMYTSIKDVNDAYGYALNAGVVNCIPTAAKFLFDNGASAIVIAQAETASNTHLQTAIDNLKVEDIDAIVVPQATNSTLSQYIRAHVLTQSAPAVRHERVYITGADGYSDTMQTIAGKGVLFASERTWVMAPPSFVTTLRDAVYQTDQDVMLPSTYMAAMWAGVVCNPSYDAASPQTRKSLVGINNLSTHNYASSTKDYLGANNITVVELSSGGHRIRHGVTTDGTNANTVTAQVVLIKDNIRKTLRPLLDKTYIGTKITERTPSQITSTIKTFLEQKISEEIIVLYKNVTVAQDVADPRTMNVRFDVKPAYELDWINVTFSLVTQ